MKWLLATLIMFTYTIAAADTLASPEQIRLLTEKVMITASSGNVRDGMNMLKPYVNIPEAEHDADTGQFASKFPMVLERFGKSLGYEFVREEKIGDFLIQITYAQKLDRNIFRWKFAFYNNGRGWKSIGWNVDDGTQAFFPK